MKQQYDNFYRGKNGGECGLKAESYINGEKSHDMLKKMAKSLASMNSRGGINLKQNTKDGAGVLLDKPTDIINKEFDLNLKDEDYGIGCIFLPQDMEDRKKAQKTIEEVLEKYGIQDIRWRKVPVDTGQLSDTTKNTMPVIEQIIFTYPEHIKNLHAHEKERILMQAHRDINILTHKADINVKILPGEKDGEVEIRDVYIPQDEKEGKTRDTINRIFKEHGLIIANWQVQKTLTHVFSTTDFEALAKEGEEKDNSSEKTTKVAPQIETLQVTYNGKDKRTAIKKAITAYNQYVREEKETTRPSTYMASLSHNHVIYKGLLGADELVKTFLDLQDEDYKSKKYIVHVRFSTNSSSTWAKAQPVDIGIAHNGEFNSIISNIIDRLTELRELHDLPDNIDPYLSDTMLFGQHLRDLMIQGDNIISAIKKLIVPVIREEDQQYSKKVKQMLMQFELEINKYLGPAHILFSGYGLNGEEVIGVTRDANGLRPSRYGIYIDNEGREVFFVGSEICNTQIDKTDSKEEIEAKEEKEEHKQIGVDFQMIKAIDAGQMCILSQNKIINDKKILEEMAKKLNTKNIPIKILPDKEQQTKQGDEEEKNRLASIEKKKLAFWDHDAFKMLDYMIENSDQKRVSMGSDIASAPFRGIPQNFAEFMKQLFAMVTAPSIDPIREKESFDTSVYFGDREKGYIKIATPILRYGQLEALGKYNEISYGEKIDISFNHEQETLVSALQRIGNKAVEQARTNGTNTIILSDIYASEDKAPIFDFLALATVKKFLEQNKLSKKVKVIVESNQVTNPHHLSVLLAFGASAVYPNLVYQHIREKTNNTKDFQKKCTNFHKNMHNNLLKNMGKVGYNRVASYINSGPGIMQAVGLDMTCPILSNIFKGIYSPYGGYNINDINAILKATFANALVTKKTNLSKKEREKLCRINNHNLPNHGIHANNPFGISHGFSHKVEEAFHTARIKHQDDERQLYNKVQKQLQETIKNKQALINELKKEIFEKKEEKETAHERFLRCTKNAVFYLPDNKDNAFNENIASIYLPLFFAEIDAVYKKFTTDNNGNIIFDEKVLNQDATLEDTYANTILSIIRNFCSKDPEYKRYPDKALSEFLYTHGMEIIDQTIDVLTKGKIRRSINGELLIDDQYSDAFITWWKESDAHKEYSQALEKFRKTNPVTLSDRMTITPLATANENKIEPKESSDLDIIERIFSGGMSNGSLTPETHEKIARSLHAVKAGGSGAGEGGMGLFTKNSIQQIASGRFGNNIKMYRTTKSMEIKVAQGAKPGEGGELPATKVTITIASNRNCMPNVELISPPPHHDIYSIEDLQALIYALSVANPDAEIGVKLAAEAPTAQIALGVAKALLFVGKDGNKPSINIAGGDGGTGAAKATSTRNTGTEAEIALLETHKKLLQEGLRPYVNLTSSGGIKNEDDIIKRFMLGADRIEIGTEILMALGCVMARECGKGAKYARDENGDYTIVITPGGCPVYLTNTGEFFVEKGQEKHLHRLLLNLAAAVKEKLNKIGSKNIDEIIGRSDLLNIDVKELNENISGNFNFDSLVGKDSLSEIKLEEDKEVEQALQKRRQQFLNNKDKALCEAIKKSIEEDSLKNVFEYTQQICTEDMAFGTYTIGELWNKFIISDTKNPEEKLEEGQVRVSKDFKIRINTKGNAGQYFAFANSEPFEFYHTGLAHDYVAGSMSGGKVVIIAPPGKLHEKADKNDIAGNSIAYGASRGKLFINGRVGPRFCVRNSGITAIVEGVGKYACEYMTMGSVLCLGKTGTGFGAGMSGGIAIVYNQKETDKNKFNKDYVQLMDTNYSSSFLASIKDLLEEYVQDTKSVKARKILDNWEQEKNKFTVVMPKSLLLKEKNLDEAIKKICKKDFTDIETLKEAAYQIQDIKKTYQKRYVKTISPFMQVWLDIQLKKANELLDNISKIQQETKIDDIENIVLKEKKEKSEKETETAIQIHKTAKKKEGQKPWEFIDIANMKYILAKYEKSESSCDCNESMCRGGCSTANDEDKEAEQTSEPYGCPDNKDIPHSSRAFEEAMDAVLDELGIKKIKGSIAKNSGRINYILNNLDKHPQIKEKFIEAFNLQAQENRSEFTSPAFGFTGILCPAPCEASCTKSAGATENVQIKSVEEQLFYIGWKYGFFTEYMEKKTQQRQEILEILKAEDKNYQPKKRVIIGSGPAAIKQAFIAWQRGEDVTIIEKADKPGGLLRYGIPAKDKDGNGKLDHDIIDFYFQMLQNAGIKVICNAKFTNYKKENDKFSITVNNEKSKEQFDYLTLATGVTESPTWPKIKINDEEKETDLKNKPITGIAQAMDFLTEHNKAVVEKNYARKLAIGKGNVVVWGGGPTGADAVSTYTTQIKYKGNSKQRVFNYDRNPESIPQARYPNAKERDINDDRGKNSKILQIGGKIFYHARLIGIKTNDKNELVGIYVEHLKYETDDCTNYIYKKGSNERKTVRDEEYEITDSGLEKETNEPGVTYVETDRLILALGFDKTTPLITNLGGKEQLKQNGVELIGDISNRGPWTIIGAESTVKAGIDTSQKERKMLKQALQQQISCANDTNTTRAFLQSMCSIPPTIQAAA